MCGVPRTLWYTVYNSTRNTQGYVICPCDSTSIMLLTPHLNKHSLLASLLLEKETKILANIRPIKTSSSSASSFCGALCTTRARRFSVWYYHYWIMFSWKYVVYCLSVCLSVPLISNILWGLPVWHATRWPFTAAGTHNILPQILQ